VEKKSCVLLEFGVQHSLCSVSHFSDSLIFVVLLDLYVCWRVYDEISVADKCTFTNERNKEY